MLTSRLDIGLGQQEEFSLDRENTFFPKFIATSKDFPPTHNNSR